MVAILDCEKNTVIQRKWRTQLYCDAYREYLSLYTILTICWTIYCKQFNYRTFCDKSVNNFSFWLWAFQATRLPTVQETKVYSFTIKWKVKGFLEQPKKSKLKALDLLFCFYQHEKREASNKPQALPNTEIVPSQSVAKAKRTYDSLSPPGSSRLPCSATWISPPKRRKWSHDAACETGATRFMHAIQGSWTFCPLLRSKERIHDRRKLIIGIRKPNKFFIRILDKLWYKSISMAPRWPNVSSWLFGPIHFFSTLLLCFLLPFHITLMELGMNRIFIRNASKQPNNQKIISK